MSTLFTAVLVSLPFVAIFLSILAGLRTMNKTQNAKRAFKRHFAVLVLSLVLIFSFTMFASAAGSGPANTETASSATAAAASGDAGMASGMGFLAAALCTGLAGIGAGIALSSGAPAAIGAVSEDPKAFGKAIIFVALGEAVAIYGFVISILIWIKIPSFA